MYTNHAGVSEQSGGQGNRESFKWGLSETPPTLYFKLKQWCGGADLV